MFICAERASHGAMPSAALVRHHIHPSRVRALLPGQNADFAEQTRAHKRKKLFCITAKCRNKTHAVALSRLLIYVKHRPGFLSYMCDPHALRERLREETAVEGEMYSHESESARILAPWARPLQPRAEAGSPHRQLVFGKAQEHVPQVSRQ